MGKKKPSLEELSLNLLKENLIGKYFHDITTNTHLYWKIEDIKFDMSLRGDSYPLNLQIYVSSYNKRTDSLVRSRYPLSPLALKTLQEYNAPN